MSICRTYVGNMCGPCIQHTVADTGSFYSGVEINDLCSSCLTILRGTAPVPVSAGSQLEKDVMAKSPWWKAVLGTSPSPTTTQLPPLSPVMQAYAAKLKAAGFWPGASLTGSVSGQVLAPDPNSQPVWVPIGDSTLAPVERTPIKNPVCTCGGKKTRSTHFEWCDNPRDNQVDL